MTNTTYGIDLSNKTHLRKQLDFKRGETAPKYICAMIAGAIHKSILAGKNGPSPRKIIEDLTELPDLLQKIRQLDIKIEKDKKGTIWVYYEPENIYIAIQKDGQFAPPKDIKAFRKAKIKGADKELALEGEFYRAPFRKKGRLKKLFLRTMLAGTIGFTFLTTTSILLYRHITYDPFGGATYRQIEVFDEEDRKVTSSWEVSAGNFLDKLGYLQNEELTYTEVLDCTNWLNQNIWYVERAGEKLDRKQLERLLDFIENPQPIKSNSVSDRWLVAITKCTIMDLWLPTIAFKQNSYNKTILATLRHMSDYRESFSGQDPLFTKYFPNINPEEVLSEKIKETAKEVLINKIQNNPAPYFLKYSKPYSVVSRLFAIFGTLEDIEAQVNKIHQIEIADTIKIPIWQLDDVEYIRKIDPKIKTYIEESAKTHSIPPRVILTHLLNVWKRTYGIDIGIDLVVRRGRMSEEQAKWLKEILEDIGIRSTYTFPPDVMAFIGGVVLDAQSTTGIGRLRPVWVQRNQGFDRFGERSKDMSTREIAWKLWSPKYNIEAIARLWEVLAQEGKRAILDAQKNKIFDTRRFSRETRARLFTRNDTARVDFYKLCPSPEIFESKGEGWMNSVWHPVEIELQLQRMGDSPWSYNPGDFLPTQIEIARSAIFRPPGQKAIITGIENKEDVAALIKFLDTKDEFVRNAVLETLDRLSKNSSFAKDILKTASSPISLCRDFIEKGANVIVFGEETHFMSEHRIIVKDVIDSLEVGEMDFLALEFEASIQNKLNMILRQLDKKETEKEARKEIIKLIWRQIEPEWRHKVDVFAYVDLIISAHKKGMKVIFMDPRNHSGLDNTGYDGYVTIDARKITVDEAMVDNILNLKGKGIVLVGQDHAMNNVNIRYGENTLPSLASILKEKDPKGVKIVLQHTEIENARRKRDVDNLMAYLAPHAPIVISNSSESVISDMSTFYTSPQTFGKAGDAVILHPLMQPPYIYEKAKVTPGYMEKIGLLEDIIEKYPDSDIYLGALRDLQRLQYNVNPERSLEIYFNIMKLKGFEKETYSLTQIEKVVDLYKLSGEIGEAEDFCKWQLENNNSLETNVRDRVRDLLVDIYYMRGKYEKALELKDDRYIRAIKEALDMRGEPYIPIKGCIGDMAKFKDNPKTPLHIFISPEILANVDTAFTERLANSGFYNAIMRKNTGFVKDFVNDINAAFSYLSGNKFGLQLETISFDKVEPLIASAEKRYKETETITSPAIASHIGRGFTIVIGYPVSGTTYYAGNGVIFMGYTGEELKRFSAGCIHEILHGLGMVHPPFEMTIGNGYVFSEQDIKSIDNPSNGDKDVSGWLLNTSAATREKLGWPLVKTIPLTPSGTLKDDIKQSKEDSLLLKNIEEEKQNRDLLDKTI